MRDLALRSAITNNRGAGHIADAGRPARMGARLQPGSFRAAIFQALPGASFVVNGAAKAPDSALTTASAEIRWLNGRSAIGTFEGEFSNVASSRRHGCRALQLVNAGPSGPAAIA